MRPHLRALIGGLLVVAAAQPARTAIPDGTASAPPQIVLMEGRGRQLVFVAEKSTQDFHVYEWKDGRARLVETLPCTTGKARGDKRIEGDLKTPEGAYRFLRYIDGDQLPPLYGAGAFVMDYPNPFDIVDRKTGSGIWMHGVETDERVHVALDTRGCVALANSSIEKLRPLARLRDTPIVVVERLEGVPPGRVASDASAMRAFVERWRAAWESKDMDGYLALHAPDFLAEGRDLLAWSRQKREVARTEGPRRIGVDELTVLREKERWWVSFRQEYSTAGHRDVGRKTLFVRGADPPAWRIVSEQWRALDGSFRVIEPVEATPRMTPELVAAIAPDAAPVTPKARRTPTPPPRRSAAPAPVPAPAQPPASAEVPTANPAPDAPAASAPAPASAPAAQSAVAPAVERRIARLAARLAAPSVNRRTFQLFAPHVQRQGESLLVQVQLLNLRATSERTGALIVMLPQAEGRPAETSSAEPFAVKQGRLVVLNLPDAELPMRIGLLVRDEAGNVALEQQLVIDELP